jgi:hypothetical protein
MSLLISTIARTAACNSITALVNSGGLNPNGYINIFTAPRPSAPEAASSPATRLVTIPLSNPAFAASANGEAIANGIGLAGITVEATGTASWYRVYDRDNNPVWDGSVSVTGDGGDMQFNDISFVLDGKVVLQSFKAIMPQ